MRVQTHIGHHAGQKYMWRSAQPAYCDGFPFEIPDCADAVGPDQLEAAYVKPGEEDDRASLIQLSQHHWGEIVGDVDHPGTDTFVESTGLLVAQVTHIGKSFRP